jgi:hypothetical protein
VGEQCEAAPLVHGGDYWSGLGKTLCEPFLNWAVAGSVISTKIVGTKKRTMEPLFALLLGID